MDVKQLNNVYQHSDLLGTDYWIGKPTQKAVDKSEIKIDSLNIEKNWYTWNR